MNRTESFGKDRLSIIDRIIYYFRVRKIEKHYNFSNKSIIDLGCGYNAKFLTYINTHYKTKDLIAFDLQLNKEYLKSQGIIGYEGDLNKSFSINENVDIAIGSAILEHLSNPTCFLTTCYKLLPKGGYLLLTVPSIWSKPVLEFMAYKLHIIDRREIEDHKKYYKKDSLIEALEAAGFDKKNIKHSYFELYMNNFVLAKK